MDTHPEIQSLTTVEVTDWQPDGVQRCLAASSRHFVGLMEDDRYVLKYPHRKTADSMEALREEADRYAHLGSHDNLVRLHAIQDDGLVFEYCEQGSLLDLLDGPTTLSTYQKRQIVEQIARCLVYIHQRNYIHCDLNTSNVFITSDMVAKVGDIQGQLYRPDGTVEMPTMSQENAKSRHPEAGEDEFSVRTALFAFGTLLYHVWYEHSPFPDLDEQTQGEEIQARFREKDFPIDVTDATGIRKVIYQCWTSGYKSASEVLEDVLRKL